MHTRPPRAQARPAVANVEQALSYPELIERPDRLEIRTPVRAGMRVLLGALGLIPLLAPYELLVRVDWEHYVNLFFVISAVISAGAVTLSAFLVFAGLASLSSSMVFDKRMATFEYAHEAPVVRHARQTRPLSEVRTIDVGVTDWSDSAPTFRLEVTLNDGAVFESGSSSRREDIEQMRSRVHQFLRGHE